MLPRQPRPRSPTAILILGPLTSPESAAVGTDSHGRRRPGPRLHERLGASAGQVSWPMGITADQQVRRLVAPARTQSKTSFAALLPDSDFGRAMQTALERVTQSAGLPPPTVRTHGAGMQSNYRRHPRFVRLCRPTRTDRCEGPRSQGARHPGGPAHEAPRISRSPLSRRQTSMFFFSPTPVRSFRRSPRCCPTYRDAQSSVPLQIIDTRPLVVPIERLQFRVGRLVRCPGLPPLADLDAGLLGKIRQSRRRLSLIWPSMRPRSPGC